VIALYIYIGLSFVWGVYNAIVEIPKYVKRMPSQPGSTEMTLMYIVNIIVGTIIAPISFYNKIIVRRRVEKQNEKLDK